MATLSKQNEAEDKCKCLRWNHAKCLTCCVCNVCRKEKYNSFEEFEDGPFAQYKQFLAEQCDPEFDQAVKLLKAFEEKVKAA